MAYRHTDLRKERYITPDYLKRSMYRLCFFEDLPVNEVVPKHELQPMLDKWEKCNGFVSAQLYALRHYHYFRSKFVEMGIWNSRQKASPDDFVKSIMKIISGDKKLK